MKCLFVVNILLSARTAGFWRKYRLRILDQFDSPIIFYPESTSDLPPVNFKDVETVVLIGDDSFFHWAINSYYQLLTENFSRNILAFIPDSRYSALTDGLGLPNHLKQSIELIKRKRTIPMDLIRCHYIDHHGLPASRLILNDAIIGLPPIRLPIIVENLAQWLGALPFTKFRRRNKNITILHEGKSIFEGEYFFSLLLLGRRVTRGPRIGKRLRINLNRFDFIQINTRSPRRIITILPNLLSGRLEEKSQEYLYKKANELEIKGLSKHNKLIADGTHIGRLPASFVLLPKAVRVISPLITVKTKAGWKKKISSAKVPKPVGSREIADCPRRMETSQNPPSN